MTEDDLFTREPCDCFEDSICESCFLALGAEVCWDCMQPVLPGDTICAGCYLERAAVEGTA